MRHSRSRLATRAGSPASHAEAPQAAALFLTISGTPSMALSEWPQPHRVEQRRAMGATAVGIGNKRGVVGQPPGLDATSPRSRASRCLVKGIDDAMAGRDLMPPEKR